jgi:hypothetical protein
MATTHPNFLQLPGAAVRALVRPGFGTSLAQHRRASSSELPSSPNFAATALDNEVAYDNVQYRDQTALTSTLEPYLYFLQLPGGAKSERREVGSVCTLARTIWSYDQIKG